MPGDRVMEVVSAMNFTTIENLTKLSPNGGVGGAL
jgi:hypothetical protein